MLILIILSSIVFAQEYQPIETGPIVKEALADYPNLQDSPGGLPNSGRDSITRVIVDGKQVTNSHRVWVHAIEITPGTPGDPQGRWQISRTEFERASRVVLDLGGKVEDVAQGITIHQNKRGNRQVYIDLRANGFPLLGQIEIFVEAHNPIFQDPVSYKQIYGNVSQILRTLSKDWSAPKTIVISNGETKDFLISGRNTINFNVRELAQIEGSPSLMGKVNEICVERSLHYLGFGFPMIGFSQKAPATIDELLIQRQSMLLEARQFFSGLAARGHIAAYEKLRIAMTKLAGTESNAFKRSYSELQWKLDRLVPSDSEVWRRVEERYKFSTAGDINRAIPAPSKLISLYFEGRTVFETLRSGVKDPMRAMGDRGGTAGRGAAAGLKDHVGTDPRDVAKDVKK